MEANFDGVLTTVLYPIAFQHRPEDIEQLPITFMCVQSFVSGRKVTLVTPTELTREAGKLGNEVKRISEKLEKYMSRQQNGE